MSRQLDNRHSFAIEPRVIVCGSRTKTGKEDARLRPIIALVLAGLPRNVTVVVGYDPKRRTPCGADMIAFQEAKKIGLMVETHPADWTRHGSSAGPIRNNKMARLGAQKCVAFYDGASTGTKDMMDRCALHNIPVEVIPWTRERRRKQGSMPSRLDG